jgi:hypothetical protein
MDLRRLPIALSDCGDCRHQRPINRCPTCIMINFLLIRNHVATDGWPFLIRDVCRIIMSKLPPYKIPPKETAYRLRDCGNNCRVRVYPNGSGTPNHAICGIEFKSAFSVDDVLYCTRSAVKAGRCGAWTCSAHAQRDKIIIDKRFIRDI